VQLHEAEGMSEQLAVGTGQTPYLCNICLAVHWHLSMVSALGQAVSCELFERFSLTLDRKKKKKR